MVTSHEEVRVMSFNVGHGDCTLFEYRLAGTVAFRCLIDGGKSPSSALFDYLSAHRRQDQSPDIDALILSHVDSDHLGGLSGLLDKGVQIGEYFGPCLPTFRRLAWLFGKSVRQRIDAAAAFELRLRELGVPVVYPLEGYVQRFSAGRVVLSVLSPAARLIERLSRADGGDLSNLLMRQPLPLQWLLESETATVEIGDGEIGPIFGTRVGLYPEDFPSELPQPKGISPEDLQGAARAASSPEFEPEFFGNSVLNDTSLVVTLDFHLDGMHRKRVLATGDQENWSYIAARYPAGLGIDVLKVPHHGGRVYLDERTAAIDALYLWMRPRTVLVSANGQHGLPRLAFRDAVRCIGATLICPNVRGMEPLTAGTMFKSEATCCVDAFDCSSTERPFSMLVLAATSEYSDTSACVQGTIHAGIAPIVVLRQDIISPSETVTRYTRGELERHARWIRSELGRRQKDFVQHANSAHDPFVARVNQTPVSWRSIAPAARAVGRHDLAIDPGAVLQFARVHRLFWAKQSNGFGHGEWILYRRPSDMEVKKARQWLFKVPRILLPAKLTSRQLITGDRLEILQSVNWATVDGLLAGMLSIPREMIEDEIRPSLLVHLADRFSARACRTDYPGSDLTEGDAYLLLEQGSCRLQFPNLHEPYWDPMRTYVSDLSSVPWKFLLEASSKFLLVGTAHKSQRGAWRAWTKALSYDCTNEDLEQRFDWLFSQTHWSKLWGR